MQSSRSTLLIAAMALLCFGVSSATSLGTFSDVALSGHAESEAACTADAELVDSFGNVILLGSLLSFITVEEVSLTGLAGECAGTVPVVVTIGDDGGGADRVLDVLDFTGRTTLLGSSPVDLDVLSSDDLHSLFDAASTLRDVRVVFCPVEVAPCV